jgi:hypothetical protein
MVITEKIDGTNAAVVVIPEVNEPNPANGILVDGHWVYAQSRTRLIPLKARGLDDINWRKQDNAGFGEWVRLNAVALIDFLGPGHHYGEWWGHGIQRGYGLEKGDRRFSLFNTKRWGFLEDPRAAPDIPGLGAVPVIEQYTFDTNVIRDAFTELIGGGSYAAPGYMNPEGIVVYHSASDQVFKVTDNADRHKGAPGLVITTIYAVGGMVA